MNDAKGIIGSTVSVAVHLVVIAFAVFAMALHPRVHEPVQDTVATKVRIPLEIQRMPRNALPTPTVPPIDQVSERETEEPPQVSVVVGGLDGATGPSSRPVEYGSQGKVLVGVLDSNPEALPAASSYGSVGPTGLFTSIGSGARFGDRSGTSTADGPAILKSAPKPVYSEEAKRLKVTGEIVLEVKVTASGVVQVLRVLKTLGHGLEQAAIEAATHAQFQPAQRAGHFVDATTEITVFFRLA
jgi:TonB family protein